MCPYKIIGLRVVLVVGIGLDRKIFLIHVRKKKRNFDLIGIDRPIQSNRKKGRSKNTLRLSTLQMQPKERQGSNSIS